MGSQGSKTPASWPPANNKYPLATFAAGCFWGVELAFQRQPGVIATAVGYAGGKKENPTYEQVCSESTGHAEAVQLAYNPQEVGYDKLVDLFFSRHNSSTPNRSGNDVGTQYRSAIYYHNDEQKKIAEQKKAETAGSVTEIAPCARFWPAEEYHQQYLEKGGRMGRGQSAAKKCSDPIRCYG
ncbi:hypothetical protein ABBQ32_007214 [Trebouxia sp. C0010 RCD-2024]